MALYSRMQSWKKQRDKYLGLLIFISNLRKKSIKYVREMHVFVFKGTCEIVI